jgi:hypothetical protein
MIEKVSDVLGAIKDFLEQQTDLVPFIGTDFEVASMSPFIVIEVPSKDVIEYLDMEGNTLSHLLNMAYYVNIEINDLWEAVNIVSDIAAVLRHRFIEKFNTDRFNNLFVDIKFTDIAYLKSEEPLLITVKQNFIIEYEEDITKTGTLITELLNRLNNYKKTRIIISESIKEE